MENVLFFASLYFNNFLFYFILFYENLFLIVNKTQFTSIVKNIKLTWLLQFLSLKSFYFDSGDVEAILHVLLTCY